MYNSQFKNRIANECKWEDYIRMELKEIDINARNWVVSTQDRDYWRALVNKALNLLVL